MPGYLLHKNTIAGAVAREVVRGGRDGIAYKAELQRQAERAKKRYLELDMQACFDAARDAQLMNELTARALEPEPDQGSA